MKLEQVFNESDLEGLHGLLVRYGGSIYPEMSDAERKFPVISEALVLAVIELSDECPVCLARFLRLGSGHVDGCPLEILLSEVKS